jgi:hypothetical protein
MKHKTALNRCLSSAKFLAIVVPAAWALFLWQRSTILAIIAVILTLTLLLDTCTILWIRRRAAKEPGFLNKNS